MTIKTTPCAGWPYPTRDELFERQHIVDLANAMDATLTSANADVSALTGKPLLALEPTVAGQNVTIATTTAMTFRTADSVDTYDLFAGPMTNGVLDRWVCRPNMAGLWYVTLQITPTVTPSNMTQWFIELASINTDTAPQTTIQVRKQGPGVMVTDTVAGLMSLRPGDQVQSRFRWEGSGGPYNIQAQLRAILLSKCEVEEAYYEDFEDNNTAGWTVSAGTLSNTNTWAGQGLRSLQWVPPGAVATIKATGPTLARPSWLPSGNQSFYVSAGIRCATNMTGPIRVGIEQFDSVGTLVSGGWNELAAYTGPSNRYPFQSPFNVLNTMATFRPYVEVQGTPTAAQIVFIDEFTVARACGISTSS